MKRLRLLSLSVLVFVALMLGVLFIFQSSKLKGRVVTADTRQPIPKAIVLVQYRMFVGPGGSEAVFVRTGDDGTFEAKLFSTDYSVRVWKDGYAENGCHVGNCNQQNGEVVLKLREIVKSNFVEAKEGFFDFTLERGFSLVKGEVVEAESKDADIIFSSDSNNKIFVETPGQSGICFKTMSEDSNIFYAPIAPEDGCYQQKQILDLDERGVCFVKIKGGTNYAKFRVSPVGEITDRNGEKRFSWQDWQIMWAYQPDGTRNLEIKPPTEVPYPFSDFYKLNLDK